MAMTMHLDIVSAEAEIFSGAVTEIYAPADQGEVGIMPRHAPLITKLKAGEVRFVEQDGKEQAFFVSGGILEIQPHVVTVLSDTVLRAQDIDEEAALKAKAKAEAQLSERKSDFNYAMARAELAEAVAKIDTIRRMRKRRK